jgi:hypothetical protein
MYYVSAKFVTYSHLNLTNVKISAHLMKNVSYIGSACVFTSYVLFIVTTTMLDYLNNGNNRRRNDRSLRDWHHNDKTDLRLYFLGTNRNSKKKHNIEAGLK